MKVWIFCKLVNYESVIEDEIIKILMLFVYDK